MIKLIACDIDGTLLGKVKVISERNRKAILAAIDKGIIFAIASGRDYHDIVPLTEGIPCHIICGNGAEYYDETGKLLMSCYMDSDACINVSNVLFNHHLYHMIFTTSGTITPMNVDEVKAMFVSRKIGLYHGDFDQELQILNKRRRFREMKYIDNLEEYIPHIDIIKVEGFDITDTEIVKIKEELKDMDHIYVSSSFRNNIEVTDTNATKGDIIKLVAQKLNIKDDEVMVMGDGLNDLSMFEMFDNSVAVENSEEVIKDLAKYHVSSADNDGVAEAIEKYVLKIK
ncbi:MAG: Cof-type HAD-IIB family hydrolase [Erysipelotrichaceae bacterium]|nr:Cof-type HAD-IIB family hydrolase [Erysipelotrichaceae bacterium]